MRTLAGSRRHAWAPAALLVGGLYFVVGRAFAGPTSHVHLWRLAAWIVCGVAYAAHTGYEHFRLRRSPRVTSVHVAVGVAMGAFALAVAGMIRSMSATTAVWQKWRLALVVWPAVTAVPALLVALVTAAMLRRLSRRDGGAKMD